MKHALATVEGRLAIFGFLGEIVARAALVAISVALFVTVHELAHLVVGRIAGIPAVFTSLTSAGVPKGTAGLYPPLALALMNGIAPLFTVIVGFAIYRILVRWPRTFGWARYFLAWWAIFGIPYLGLQMMIAVTPVDYSGNGSDSAAVAGYFHVPISVRAIICVAGFLLYMVSAVWVLAVIRAVDPYVRAAHTATDVPPWRRVLGYILVLAAMAGIVTVAKRALYGEFPGAYMGAAFLGWAIAAAVLTRWHSQAARAVWIRWLLPEAIGMLALVPVGFIGSGNDYASIWLPVIPPVMAAAMFAA